MGSCCLLLPCCLLGWGRGGQNYSLHSPELYPPAMLPVSVGRARKNLLTPRAAVFYSSVRALHLPGSLNPGIRSLGVCSTHRRSESHQESACCPDRPTSPGQSSRSCYLLEPQAGPGGRRFVGCQLLTLRKKRAFQITNRFIGLEFFALES